MGDLSHEPSMEEILSSIKRIIAEDTDAALSPPRPKRAVGRMSVDPAPTPEPEVLELTEAAQPEDTSAADPAPAAPEEAAAPMPEPVQIKPVRATPQPAAAPAAAAPLVSDAALGASRSSIAALSALIVKPEVAGSDTLEGMVRDMLKPMLAEWLDANLPAIVERQVAQEIARITARG